MCSWCWGFAPIMKAFRESYPNQFEYRLVVGGLRAGRSAAPLDDQMKSYIGHHWREVERRTKQPFDHAFLERDDFVYDTGPACRAVVAFRRLRSELTFEYMHRLQEAFYARGSDPTELETFLGVADTFDLSRHTFASEYESQETAKETLADFRNAVEMGAQGFPSTLLREGSRLTTVSRGWLPLKELERTLRPWLAMT